MDEPIALNLFNFMYMCIDLKQENVKWKITFTSY